MKGGQFFKFLYKKTQRSTSLSCNIGDMFIVSHRPLPWCKRRVVIIHYKSSMQWPSLELFVLTGILGGAYNNKPHIDGVATRKAHMLLYHTKRHVA